jgi:hypothetical protein
MSSVIERYTNNYFNAIRLRVSFNEMLKIQGSSLADAAALWFSTEDNKSFLIDDAGITSLIPDLYNFVMYGKLLDDSKDELNGDNEVIYSRQQMIGIVPLRQIKVRIRYEMTMIITESTCCRSGDGIPALWVEVTDHFGNGHHPRFLIDQPTMIQLLPELVYFTQNGELVA